MKRARGAEPTTNSNKKSKEVDDEERKLNESFLVERHNLLNQINVPSPPSFNDVNAGANTIKSSDDSPPAKDLMSFNTDVSELPLPPPPLLQEQDFLTQINVHCQCEAGVNSFFKGFTFVYNSKAEITVGKVRGTTESACKLEHGEHIVHFDCTDGNSAFIFHTTNGRRWYIHCNKQTFVDGSPKGVWLPSTNVLLTTPDRHGNPILSQDWPSAFQRRGRAPVGRPYNWEKINWKPREFPGHRRMSASNGSAIVSISFGKKWTIKTLAISDTMGELPTLATIAARMLPITMRRDASMLEKNFNDDLFELDCKFEHDDNVITQRTLTELRTSKETTELERMEYDVEAINRFKQQAREMIFKSDAAKNLSVVQFNIEHKEILENRKSARQNLFASQVEMMNSVSTSAEDCRVCTSLNCRKTFVFGTASARHRCSVDGCPNLQLQCGCTTRPCTLCHDTFCEFHLKDHDEDSMCEKSILEGKRCGYDGDSGRRSLQPDCCGKVLDENVDIYCTFCYTLMCRECGTKCTGFDRDEGKECVKYWCSSCKGTACDCGTRF